MALSSCPFHFGLPTGRALGPGGASGNLGLMLTSGFPSNGKSCCFGDFWMEQVQPGLLSSCWQEKWVEASGINCGYKVREEEGLKAWIWGSLIWGKVSSCARGT